MLRKRLFGLVSMFLVGANLSAGMLDMGSENMTKNLRNQNNDVAQYNGSNYCNSMFSNFYSKDQSNESIAENYAKSYFEDHKNWIPYKNDWMNGCITAISQKRR
jgi:hypothetical protein